MKTFISFFGLIVIILIISFNDSTIIENNKNKGFFFIWGTDNTQILIERINEKCLNCGNQNSINMAVFQEYFHLMWIPIIPLNKIGTSFCVKCRQGLQMEKFPDNYKKQFGILKSKSNTPFWTFIGSILIAILFVWHYYPKTKSNI